MWAVVSPSDYMMDHIVIDHITDHMTIATLVPLGFLTLSPSVPLFFFCMWEKDDQATLAKNLKQVFCLYCP